jgi:hypothetical protein
MSDVRIGVVGSGGTGKSLLGHEFSERTGIPFLAAKQITVDILKRDGYDYAAHIQVERFLAHAHRQHEILERTKKAQGAEGSFIVDRTFVDLAAYALCEMHDSDPKELREIMEECHNGVKVYTHLFLCPWAGVDLRRNNERRTLNPYYQLLIHEIMVGLLTDWGIPYHQFCAPDADGRIEEIVGALKKSGVDVEFRDKVEEKV